VGPGRRDNKGHCKIGGEKMSKERTVTISLPKNLDEFYAAYAQLLKYKSVEDFLKEEIEWHIGIQNVRDNLEIFFDDNVIDQIAEEYDLEASCKPKVKVVAKP